MGLAFKYGHVPELRPDGAIWIGPNLHGRATELREQTGVLWELCLRLDGSMDRGEVVDAVVANRPDADAGQLGEILDYFVSSGWLLDTAAPPPPELTARDLDRHSRGEVFLSAIDFRPESTGYGLQAKLKAAKVVVLGIGGVGSAAATGLAAAGIGRLHCVDHDIVELSNLNRQLLYTEQDIGTAKVDAAVKRLRSLNSDIEITGADVPLDGPQAMARECEGADAVVLCADHPPHIIRQWMDQVAFDRGIPWLCAHYDGPKFSTACFIPGKTACHGCLRATTRARQRSDGRDTVMPAFADAPKIHAVLAPSAQISGHYLVMETIRLLLGLEVQTAGRELCRFLTDYEQHFYLEAEAQDDCPVRCGALLGR